MGLLTWPGAARRSRPGPQGWAVCLRRSPAGRGSISRELSNLDSGRWEWPAHGGTQGGCRAGTIALKNGDKLHPSLAPLDHHNHITGSNSGLSVLTGHTSLTP